METTVVNIHHGTSFDVYVGRAGKGYLGYYGNPFNSGTREEKINNFKTYFYNRLKSDPEYRKKIHDLKGKTLGCFCIPLKCHASVIADYLNALPEENSIRLGVVGSRTFNDYDYMCGILKWYEAGKIISGGANGADKLAAKYAVEHSIPLQEFLPDWDKYGKKAGYLRNKQIVDNSDEIVAFMDKKNPTPGTQSTIKLAEDAGKPVYIYWSSVPQNESVDEMLNRMSVGT